MAILDPPNLADYNISDRAGLTGKDHAIQNFITGAPGNCRAVFIQHHNICAGANLDSANKEGAF